MNGIAGYRSTLTDVPLVIGNPTNGITAVNAITTRGALNTPTLVRNWNEFQAVFGGLSREAYIDPYQCKIMLDLGTPLMVSRLAHYSDSTDLSTVQGVRSVNSSTTGNTGISFRVKEYGAFGNRISLTVQDSSLGADFMDIVVSYTPENDPAFNTLDEAITYTVQGLSRLVANKLQTIADFNRFSPLVQFLDYTNPVVNFSTAFTSGAMTYTNLGVNDYVGNAAIKTGFQAFNDTLNLTAMVMLPAKQSTIFNSYTPFTLAQNADREIAFSAYVANRKIIGYAPNPVDEPQGALAYENRTEGTITAKAKINNAYFRYTCFTHAVSNLLRYDDIASAPRIHSVVFFAGIRGGVTNRFNAFTPEAGAQRGTLPAFVLDISHNMYANSNKTVADALYNRGSNYCILDPTFGLVLWGNGTAKERVPNLIFPSYYANVMYSQVEIDRAVEGIARTKILSTYNTPETWAQVFSEVTQYLDGEPTTSGAVIDYIYEGDQTVTNIADAVINTPQTIAQGIYKFKLRILYANLTEYINAEFNITVGSL